jgi:5-aminolevulinate synthase
MERIINAGVKVCPFARKYSHTVISSPVEIAEFTSKVQDCPFLGSALLAHSPKPSKFPKASRSHFSTTPTNRFDYSAFCTEELEKKHRDKSYRYFNNINRLAEHFPKARTGNGEVATVWCSNDYLGMSNHPKVLESMKYWLLT